LVGPQPLAVFIATGNSTVVSRNVTIGQTVAASFQTPTLFLIASDLKKMEVDTNVSESDIGGLKEGNPATFTVDAFPKRTFTGRVSQVRQSPQTVRRRSETRSGFRAVVPYCSARRVQATGDSGRRRRGLVATHNAESLQLAPQILLLIVLE
jgi:hypothetical protein